MPEPLQAAQPDERGLWLRLLATPEGKILLAGVVLLALYFGGVGLTALWSPGLSQDLLEMTGFHVVGGRAAGILKGYERELWTWLVIPANIAIEAFLVMLFYPVFVFSHRKLIVIRSLQGTMARTRRAAETHRSRVSKWRVIGLFVFVLFPFYMTGPVVGCVIGFLIGLRPWVNMAVVLAGTAAATVGWGVGLRPVFEQLRALASWLPGAVVLALVLLAVALYLRERLARKGAETQEAGAKGTEE